MKRLLISALLGATLLLVPTTAQAQSDPEATLFVGYSFLRPHLEAGGDGDAHGGHVEYTYYANGRVGFTLSASGHWGTVPAGPNIFGVAEYNLQDAFLLGGPQFVLWRGHVTEIGFEALAGVAWRTLDTSFSGADVFDDTSLAFGGSLHVDVRLTDKVWLRALEPSVVATKYGDRWRGNLRVSIGLVLRSGEILQ